MRMLMAFIPGRDPGQFGRGDLDRFVAVESGGIVGQTGRIAHQVDRHQQDPDRHRDRWRRGLDCGQRVAEVPRGRCRGQDMKPKKTMNGAPRESSCVTLRPR